jgi:hypothetical protein
MYNNVEQIGELQTKTVTKLEKTSAPEDIKELTLALDSMMRDNEEGQEKCLDALMLKQISAGAYTPVLEATDLRAFCQKKWGRTASLTIAVEPAVPAWVQISCPLLNIIVGNAIHNAMMHGKRSGTVTLRLAVVGHACQLLISVENEAGKNHAAALRMQEAHGTNAMLANKEGVDMKGMGSSQSTYLGMDEMQQAAAVMGAEASLVFYPQEGLTAPHTVFSLTTELMPTTAPRAEEEEDPSLKEGVLLICVDDDKMPRKAYSGLCKKLKPEESMILGETYEEVLGLTELILDRAATRGDANVVVILDQNLDYDQGKAKGTEIILELRQAGFSGVALILLWA